MSARPLREDPAAPARARSILGLTPGPVWAAGLGLSGLLGLLGCEVAIPDRLALVVADAGAGVLPPCVDADGDGICAADDCDDGDPTRGGAERCDGVDNDCDGLVDEGLGVGGACTGLTAGGCQRPGVVSCLPFGGTACDLLPGPPEACNGLDDDCDGLVDEGSPGAGGACDAGGVGACAAGRFACTEGALGCVADLTPGQQAETCNGLDDDCDGAVDEGELGLALTAACYFGPPGTLGVGKCLAGSWSCLAGRWGPCEGEVRPVDEICDNSDNNCDGEVDNLAQVPGGEALVCACDPEDPELDLSCYGGPAGTRGVGLCVDGTRTCQAGAFTPCVGAVTPVAERCDGLDNDCDGAVDEGFGVGDPCSVGVGACEVVGVGVCDAVTEGAGCDAVPAAPGEEVCDGVDNDCDGRVDEVLGEGAACLAGIGGCARPGVLTCELPAEGLPDGEFGCNAQPGEPEVERCNGTDDDCDGAVDEGFALGAPCEVGVGACARSGTWVCTPDEGAACSVLPGGASPETCDGLDNDCDGTVDEGFGVGNACAGVGVCGPGVRECDGVGQARCSTGSGGSEDGSTVELCDGLDNDCDGAVDESWLLGEPCSYWCNGENLSGVTVCEGGGVYVQCSAAPGGPDAPPEVCGDGVDDDCDGLVDEGCP